MTLPPSQLFLALAALPLGTATGILHFTALRGTTRALVEAQSRRALMLTLGRGAVTGGLLILAALAGALPLLSTALGIALGRAIVLRHERTAP